MKVLLVGNYSSDKQQSMQRFADMMSQGLRQLGHETRVIKPEAIAGKVVNSRSRFAKWFGYIDKMLLFPRQLRKALKWADVVHICDHSNSIYTSQLRRKPHVVTCHDLLAVRGALGQDTDCPASMTGKVLQRWILRGLKRAQAVVCDSDFTRKDLEDLIEPPKRPRVDVVLLGLNHSYRVIDSQECARRLAAFSHLDTARPFVLTVGSSLKRKNREGVLRIFNRTKDQWDAQLVFAGSPLDEEQSKLVNDLGLSQRVLHVEPDNDLLEALYNRATALIFPSKFEGFGWPIIEAQACGCPVVCSDRCSLPQVASDSAVVLDIKDEDGFARALLQMNQHGEREKWARRGFENLARFSTSEMVQSYLRVYEELQVNCRS
jgi:glycosyltransferase involved in cell wall biosynthesis